jgi:hypothetical protein
LLVVLHLGRRHIDFEILNRFFDHVSPHGAEAELGDSSLGDEKQLVE